MLPACELSIGTSPQPARPTSTASKTVRIDENGRWSASGKSAFAPSSENAPASPWYATMSTARIYGLSGLGSPLACEEAEGDESRGVAAAQRAAAECAG